MGSDGADMQKAHERVMASLTSLHVPRRESMHAVVLEAFPSTRLDNMGLPCGVGSFKESGQNRVRLQYMFKLLKAHVKFEHIPGDVPTANASQDSDISH